MATLVILVAACSTGTPPTQAPTSQPTTTTGQPTATSGQPTSTTGEPTATTGQPTSTPSTGPTAGGTLIFAEWQPTSQLNPFFSTAFTTFESLGPALRGLLTINEDGQWVADLATEVPTSDNGDLVVNPDAPADCTTTDAPTGVCFTVTLKMKPGYSWSDGKPVTMNDVLATYNWAAEVGQAGIGCSGCATTVPLIDASIQDPAAKFAPGNRYIKDFTVAADGMSATITWQKNFAGWLGWSSGAPLQADWLATIPADENANSSIPVGPGVEKVPWNGPFMITAASTDGIDYAPNPGWGGTPTTLEGLREKFYASKDGMITDYLAGNVDLALDMTQADYAAIQGVDPSIGKAELDSAWQYEHFDLNTDGGSLLGSTDKKITPAAHGLDDVNVRTAIAMAVNKQDLVDVLFPGQGVEPACTVAPPGTPWRDDSIQCAAYDPQGAMDLLTSSGYAQDPDSGLWTKGDVTIGPLQLCTTAGNPTRLTELGKMNQYLQAIGIPSNITTADAGSVVFAGFADVTYDTNCSIYRGTYDIADYAYVLGGDIYGNYFYTYSSSQIPETNPNGSNDTRLNNPDMDTALNALGYEVDLSKQNQYASTVQQTIATQNNEIPLYYRAETTGVSVHMGGWNKYNPSSVGPTWHVEDWNFIP
jgi:ABC-type transport system substrate-binding protein